MKASKRRKKTEEEKGEEEKKTTSHNDDRGIEKGIPAEKNERTRVSSRTPNLRDSIAVAYFFINAWTTPSSEERDGFLVIIERRAPSLLILLYLDSSLVHKY
jgi:hypothetical protein